MNESILKALVETIKETPFLEAKKTRDATAIAHYLLLKLANRGFMVIPHPEYYQLKAKADAMTEPIEWPRIRGIYWVDEPNPPRIAVITSIRREPKGNRRLMFTYTLYVGGYPIRFQNEPMLPVIFQNWEYLGQIREEAEE